MLNFERRADAVRTVVHMHDQVALFIKSPGGAVMVPGGENEAPPGCDVDHGGGVKAKGNRDEGFAPAKRTSQLVTLMRRLEALRAHHCDVIC